MNYPSILHTFVLHNKTYIYIAIKSVSVYVCVLNTILNILHSLIPPKERKYTASLKGNRKNTGL